MKKNLLQLKEKVTRSACRMVVVACFATPVFAQNVSSVVLTDENQKRIELAVWKYAIDTPFLMETIAWIHDLTKNTRESAAIAELSRLEFMRAQLEFDRDYRIQLFERSIVTADRALMMNPNDVRGLFWKAAAMGKMAESSGILNALRMLRPMELLLKVVELDERCENAGAHRALVACIINCPVFR